MRSLLLLALHLLSWPSLTSADFLVFSESFGVETTTTAGTMAAYPGWTFSVGSSREVKVEGGVLHLSPQNVPDFNPTFQTATINGFAGDLVIEADLGKNLPEPDFNTGLLIGGNRLVFHPGLGGTHPGSFRVEGPGGFENQDMGFIPASGSLLHHMTVTVNASSGLFGITVTDANNSLNVYSTSFTNSGYAPGDSIGFVMHGNLLDHERYARFDNLTIVSSVPEPSSLAIAGVGILGLAGWKLRCRWHKMVA